MVNKCTFYLQNDTSARVWRCQNTTSKNPNTHLNVPYILPHIQSHSPRAPLWPSPPAFCGLVLPVSRGRFSRLTFLTRELSTNNRYRCHLCRDFRDFSHRPWFLSDAGGMDLGVFKWSAEERPLKFRRPAFWKVLFSVSVDSGRHSKWNRRLEPS